MMLSSRTRFVDAISNAIAAVKFAPLRKIERASATAAYEHDDEAAPSASAVPIERGWSSGSSWLICCFETTACTPAERAKPRISGHRISHPIAIAIPSARRTASIIGRSLASAYSSDKQPPIQMRRAGAALARSQLTFFCFRHPAANSGSASVARCLPRCFALLGSRLYPVARSPESLALITHARLRTQAVLSALGSTAEPKPVRSHST